MIAPSSHHLAQINVARMRFPLDDVRTAGFVERLEPVNALADRAPGFVWRLQDEAGDATSIRVFDDPMIIVNMSLWQSLEALYAFVYRSGHVEVMRRRRQWFEPAREPYTALWWVPASHRPLPAEGAERLEHLRRHGPSAVAFTFRQPFDAPERAA